MKKLLPVCAAMLLTLSGAAFAQAPADAPAGSTGQCKDMSYSQDASKRGACSGHKGVKQWFGANAGAQAASAPSVAPKTSMPEAPVAAKPAAAKTAAAPAPGGGPGQVWVNSKSKVYHCSGTKYYGTTKEGKYMTEAEAKAAGNHADHGKACSS